MEKAIVWVDVEAAGTLSGTDQLLEVAAVLTDMEGDLLADPYSSLVTVKSLTRVIEESDDVVKSMHEKSGLWRDLWTAPSRCPEVIDEDLQQLLEAVPRETLLLFGGNSPHLDRMYNELYFPGFNRLISHRSIDVTTLSMVLQGGLEAPMFRKANRHRALPDVWDCIAEYQHYLAWLRTRERVGAPIASARSVDQLGALLATPELTAEQVALLDERSAA